MGWFSDNSKGDANAVREYKAAKAELERVSRRDPDETDDFLKANRRVAEAKKSVPWVRR